MSIGPFLTALDSRAAVKGSMDPLGQLTIWTRFGRSIVANLTTVANSARDFGVLQMGAWLAEEVAAKTGTEQDLSTFIKWESLIAYSRVSREPRTRLRGIERVKRRLTDSSSPHISADKTDQILSNQKMYGLFGLFTVPSRRSGLLEEGRFRLTPGARDFVEHTYVSRLDSVLPRGTDGLVSLLCERDFKFHLAGKDAKLADGLHSVFGLKLSKPERSFFREWLLFAQHAPDAVVQQQAAEVLLATVEDADFGFSLKTLNEMAGDAGKRFKQSDLEQRLLDVATCESVIGPSARLFSFALGREGDSLEQISKDVSKAWKAGLSKTVNVESFERLQLPAIVGSKQGGLWNEAAGALHAGDWVRTIDLLLRINAAVMHERGNSAPWAEVENGKLKVRRRDESAALDEWKQVPNIWLHSYFLDSLRLVAAEVGGAS